VRWYPSGLPGRLTRRMCTAHVYFVNVDTTSRYVEKTFYIHYEKQGLTFYILGTDAIDRV